jgi:hypothetical protein
MVFLTNHFVWSAQTIRAVFRSKSLPPSGRVILHIIDAAAFEHVEPFFHVCHISDNRRAHRTWVSISLSKAACLPTRKLINRIRLEIVHFFGHYAVPGGFSSMGFRPPLTEKPVCQGLSPLSRGLPLES